MENCIMFSVKAKCASLAVTEKVYTHLEYTVLVTE